MTTAKKQEEWWVEAGYPRNLVAAMCQVMQDVPAVRKTGRNQYDGYTYASDLDLAKAVQPALVRAGLALVPSGVDAYEVREVTTSKGGTAYRSEIMCRYELRHISGESMEITVVGAGQDRTDKDPYKAMTGCWKYAVTQAFNLPRGDDVEQPQPEPDSDMPPELTKFPAGPHKGKEIGYVWQQDAHYIRECAQKARNPHIREACAAVVKWSESQAGKPAS